MKIALASDHAGFTLKEAIAAFLREQNIPMTDFGCFSLESVDYPDFLYPATLAVARAECDRGILVAGAGYAAGILANKVPGIRAAVAEDLWSVRICRQHGDANILCLGGVTVGAGLARELVQVFLDTEFLGGKYAARNDKVSRIERGHSLTAPSAPPPPDPRDKALDLVTEKDIEQALHFGKTLLVRRDAIITPSARDWIDAKKISVRYID